MRTWRSAKPGLRRWKERNLVGIAARDVLEGADVSVVGRDVSALAEASLEVALEALAPPLPFAVIALGRFGGAELSYASDLDVLFVYEGETPADFAEAERIATAVRRFVGGSTPAARMWEVDADLRPEGKQGPLARSVEGFSTYFGRWALVWERQAMVRARPVAGDTRVAERFMALLDDFVWGRGVTDDEVREIRRIKARIERERIPPTDDPTFHLKLGRGSLSDVEFTAQLLQLQHGVPETATIGALDRLRSEGLLENADHGALIEAYRFCERTRNRLFLTGAGSNALPQQPDRLRVLARAFDTSPVDLREDYRRVTRRSRAVVERIFYGRPATLAAGLVGKQRTREHLVGHAALGEVRQLVRLLHRSRDRGCLVARDGGALADRCERQRRAPATASRSARARRWAKSRRPSRGGAIR